VGIAAPTLTPRAPSAPALVTADPELLALFIEEAREELAKIQKHFPSWEQNPLEQDGLITIRRSFHTLKGSGRMVGARELSEFAWAVENLLNRLLDNTVTRSPQILAVLRDAVAALPQLIDQLETHRAPTTDTASIVARAHALASTKPPQEGRPQVAAVPNAPVPAEKKTVASAALPPAAAPSPSASPSPASGSATSAASSTSATGSHRNPRDDAPASTHFGSDDLLKDIYSRETAAHVATVRAFVERERGKPAPHLLTEELYRACHTLSGSSKMAEARHGTRLAEPLDHWLRKAYSNGAGVGLVTSDLDLISDCMTAMESVASHLDEATGFFLTHEGLRSRIAQAESAMELRIADAAKHAAEMAATAASTMADDSPSEQSIQGLDALLAQDASAESSGEIVEEMETGIVEEITLESRVLNPDPVIESSEPLIDFLISEEPPALGEITVETPAVEDVVLSTPEADELAEEAFAADTARDSQSAADSARAAIRRPRSPPRPTRPQRATPSMTALPLTRPQPTKKMMSPSSTPTTTPKSPPFSPKKPPS
jgi:chemosensory pili system protein ChpA (sensor histidine kinase/response regulator)